MIESIFVETLRTIQLRRPAKSVDEIFFNTPEVVLCLSVSKAEYGTCVSPTKDVWHAVAISINSDGAGQVLH